MLITLNIPDKYIFKWHDLQERVGESSFEQLCINALGIGIKTIEQATKITNKVADNVVKFDPEYLDKQKKL